MHKRDQLLRTAGLLTLMSLLLRVVGLYGQSRITGIIGAEGVGLMQLSLAVQALAVTVGTSGIRYSVTRLVAEELGLGRPQSIPRVLRVSLRYALIFSGGAALLLYRFAGPLSLFAGDARVEPSLRWLALGLPFLSLNAVFGGYFTATQRPWKASLAQILEQVTMTAFVLLLLPRAGRDDLAQSCALIGMGGALADMVSLALSLLLFGLERGGRIERRTAAPAVGLGGRLLRLSLPLALSSYARTALSTLQHLLVPKALRRAGATAGAALAVYGTVSGMALPVLFFFSVFFTALAEVIIPTLTETQMQGDTAALNRTARQVLSRCLLLAAGIALSLFVAGPALGQILYKSAEAGRYIRALAPLVLVMYMDSVVDGMLKGLGLQLDAMFINILDAGITLIMVWFLLPRYGAAAYIFILYFSECFNFMFSLGRLRRLLRRKGL